MEGGGYGGGNRGEAERWLYTANKVLSARDLHGARSFAIRARESDPRYEPTQLLLTVIETLMAGEARIKEHLDWYAILQVLRYTQNIDYIGAQYRRLASQLDPHHNPFAFAAHAYSLVHDAWSLLSNPAKKAFYDNQLRLLTPPPPHPHPHPHPLPPVTFFSIQPKLPQMDAPKPTPTPTPRVEPHNATTDFTPTHTPQGSTFWTACPYCYAMYEYPNLYQDCTLRCQNCRRGFHALVLRSPPNDGLGSFCSWGFFPLAFSGHFKDISASSSNWNPFSPLFPSAFKAGQDTAKHKNASRVFYRDESSAEFVETASDTTEDDSNDDDWCGEGTVSTTTKRKRKRKRKRRGNVGGGRGAVRREPIERPNIGILNGAVNNNMGNAEPVNAAATAAAVLAVPESSNKTALFGSRRRSERNLGKLDLNVEFSNEVEEHVHGLAEGNGTENAEDNIEGIGFFEGLDEFLSSLPILNVVGDDKIKGN